MSRRPKLIVGDLYYVKSFYEWNSEGYVSEEYLAKILLVGENEFDNNKSGYSAVRVQFLILASTKDDISLGDLHYDFTTASYPWKKSWVIEYPLSQWRNRPDRIIIQKFNPKKLPLYLNWGYGIEVIRGMLKGTYDKSGRPYPAKPAVTA